MVRCCKVSYGSYNGVLLLSLVWLMFHTISRCSKVQHGSIILWQASLWREPHLTPITQSITACVSTHSYHDHRDESENYDEDENDDDTEEENLSLKPLNAAFRPFHCSFRSDSKFIVPSNTNWFDNQTMSKNHHWSSTRTDFCSHGVQQKNAKSKERLKQRSNFLHLFSGSKFKFGVQIIFLGSLLKI